MSSETIGFAQIASHTLTRKKTVRVPRLELCGALLLAKLASTVQTHLNMTSQKLYLWSDSEIVLAWLEKPPLSWKTYVSNRIAQILDLVEPATWRHLSSADNPADLGTRGCKPLHLATTSLWWNGPNWLKESQQFWPQSPIRNIIAPESRKVETSHTILDDNDILERFSSFPRALKVVAYMFKFVERLKNEVKKTPNSPDNMLTHQYLQKAKVSLVAYTQTRYFSREILLLRESKLIDKKSQLLVLNPFLDTKGLHRANGRLANSSLTYNERHPIIIPEKSSFATPYLRFLHLLMLHAEHRLMQQMVRQEYYIPRLKPQIKKCIFMSKEQLAKPPITLKAPTMVDEDKPQGTPAEATRLKQGAKERKTKDFSGARFISDSDSLVRYCTKFSSAPIEDNSESVLEIKNHNLDNFWARLQAAYDTIIETDDSDLPENFKASAAATYENLTNMKRQKL
ncbi:uncharacterized protein LOC118753207 [Rhagoletis pomonella]|uniref:uncharacterized protein LOC118753207 n=1 Tax=Rhagoletis pomonella TaxID=28610 RepID=UPI0017834171|nr:uncharacterized protein LOC118753207 [Rhagoletis pomonella]